jgi:hypothetical protein
MILWWVRIYNDFEVNSKETRNPLTSRFFLIFHFFFSQATGEKSVFLEDTKELI